MLGQKRVIEILKEKNLSDRIKVLVGGAPVNRNGLMILERTATVKMPWWL